MGLADQGCLQTFFDESVFDMLHGAGTDPQSGRHISHLPRVAVLTRIAQKPSAGVEKLRCRCLPAAGKFREFVAFRLREGDSLSIGHTGEKSRKAQTTMNNAKISML